MSESSPIKHPTWLTSGDFTEADEPLRLFSSGSRSGQSEPRSHRHSLRPSMRRPAQRADVLMKGFDERGFVFYTTSRAKKARIGRKRESSAAVHWKSSNRQVRLRDRSGGRGCRGGRLFRNAATACSDRRWASKQSAPLESRLGSKSDRARHAKFAIGTVPRPPYWTGTASLRCHGVLQDRPYGARPRRVPP